MRLKERPTRFTAPRPDECSGYIEYETSQAKLADLRRRLAEAEASEEAVCDPKRVDSAISSAARQLLNGDAVAELPDARGDLERLHQEMKIVRYAIAMAEQAADAARRKWVNAVREAVMPSYCELAKAYASALVQAARIGNEVRDLFDCVYGATGSMLPAIVKPLGDPNDSESRVCHIIRELASDGLIDESDVRKLLKS